MSKTRKPSPFGHNPLGERLLRREMTRRDFLWLTSLASLGASVPWLGGCAIDPVTGERTLVGLSEGQEVALDQQQSPHQFSNDYGQTNDAQLNAYVTDVGNRLASISHRPELPYNYRVLNANYVNAYTFPGGSMATTRGIMLEMENEAELAGLLGHEIGHVNARHAAERAGRSMLAQAALLGATVAAATSESLNKYAGYIQLGGSIGASALLSKYSRDNEREADALGMEYMTKSGYSPDGMVDLMDMLVSQHSRQPNLLETMFSSHPMSQERYATAVADSQALYAGSRSIPKNRERYMDNTSRLRRIAPAIQSFQKGEKSMAQKKPQQAVTHFNAGLKRAPNDYAGLVLMAKGQMALEKPRTAERYLAKAKALYPGEAQAVNLSGISQMAQGKFDKAYNEFHRYGQLLPGNPNTLFLKGNALEGMQHKQAAAQTYHRYLQQVNAGGQAKYAYQRLVDWGYVKSQ